MAAVTYDAQSLMVDSRRVWLVGTSIDYSRTPRARWRQAVVAAREAGCNCITTSVVWSLHEPEPGRFHFDDELDLHRFIEIIGEEGLFCSLRAGPYVGPAFEGGGLPAWLSGLAEMKPREASRPFLDGCARWFTALMNQIADLQTTTERNGKTGHAPLLLMQIEHDWRCHHPDEAAKYMGELIRFLREEGCQIPLLEANNCWQEVEGAFSTWRGSDDLAAHMRQFRLVQQSPPVQDFPLFVSELTITDDACEWTLAQALAARAQFTLQTGGDPALLRSARRIATFANQFGHVFSHLHHDRHHATLLPQEDDRELAIVHQHGAQGDVVFLFKSARDTRKQADLLMPDGQTLSVPLGKDRAAWMVFNVNLSGVATLDYTNLRPFAFLDRRLLVLFGPAGSAGVVCIDGAAIDVVVPKGAGPAVLSEGGLTVVVLNEEQVDATCISATGLYVGAGGFDGEGAPLPHRAFNQIALIANDGTTSKIKSRARTNGKKKAAPKLSAWSTASAAALIDGSSEGYREMTPTTALEALAPASHHGWHRLQFKHGKPGGQLLAPHWGRRVRLFSRGKPIGEIDDRHADMQKPFAIKAAKELTALACCDHRISEGWRLGEATGLAGHLYQVKPVKLGKPKIELSRVPDATPWRAFLSEVSYQMHPTTGGWAWTFKPAGRHAVILQISELPFRVLVVVNDKVAGGYDPVESAGRLTLTLDLGKQITSGRNTIRLALMEQNDHFAKVDPRKFVKLYDATANLTAKAQWSFAPLIPPANEAFSAKGKRPPRGMPCWFRATFKAAAAGSLSLQLRGMSGGEAWLNGQALGHYGGEAQWTLPASWLQDGENVVILFEERGQPPRAATISVQE